MMEVELKSRHPKALSQTHLGQAIHSLCDTRGTTAKEIAGHAGIHHSMLSRAANGVRLETKSLRALCTRQPDSRDGLALLAGHLMDEIERAGRSASEVRISADDREMDDDIRKLAEESKIDPQLREVLHEFAVLIRTHPLQTTQEPKMKGKKETTGRGPKK
jgi:transcriptional regulator with XRE-family HTH domain